MFLLICRALKIHKGRNNCKMHGLLPIQMEKVLLQLDFMVRLHVATA